MAKALSIQERQYLDRYVVDEEYQHIWIIDSNICIEECPHQACTYSCPTQCYVPSETTPRLVEFYYDACVECGTCRIICDLGNVAWTYPRGGRGIQYKFG